MFNNPAATSGMAEAAPQLAVRCAAWTRHVLLLGLCVAGLGAYSPDKLGLKLDSELQESGQRLGLYLIPLTPLLYLFGTTLSTPSRFEAENYVDNLKSAVDWYWVMRQEYPDSLSQLVSPPAGLDPFIERIPEDPWGNLYQYREGGDEFRVFSMGPDGAVGGGDDICGREGKV